MKKKTNTTLRVALLALTALFLLAALGGCSESQEAAGGGRRPAGDFGDPLHLSTPFAKEHGEDFAAGEADLSADYAAALEEHFPGRTSTRTTSRSCVPLCTSRRALTPTAPQTASPSPPKR